MIYLKILLYILFSITLIICMIFSALGIYLQRNSDDKDLREVLKEYGGYEVIIRETLATLYLGTSISIALIVFAMLC